jgi:hypothetical protein
MSIIVRLLFSLIKVSSGSMLFDWIQVPPIVDKSAQIGHLGMLFTTNDNNVG